MLTVKVLNGPREYVIECRETSLMERHFPESPSLIPAYDDRILHVHGVNGTNEIRELGAGEIFVMNEAGSTVARYRLGNQVTQGRYADPRDASSANTGVDGGTALKAA